MPEFVKILQKCIIEPSLLDIVFQQGRISELRASIIHDFIKNFIDERKLFLDIILGDIAIEVGFADEDEMVQELDGHGTVDVGLGGGQEDQVFVGDAHVGNTVHQEDGVVAVLLGGDDLGAVVGNLGAGDVVFEASVDQDLALDVNEYDLTDHV